MKKKMTIIAAVSLATSIFGLEPSEVVRLYRAVLTNAVPYVEFEELREKNRDLLLDAMSRMNGLELMLMYGNIDSVSVTSTNMVITFRDVVEKRDALILIPDKEVTIVQHRQGALLAIPVLFKNKKKGFRITDSFAHMADEMHNVGYVALSDRPTEVSEKDVDMIMMNGEWKTAKEYYSIVERQNRLQELRFKYNDRRREAENLFQGEALTNRLAVIEREARLEKERIESGEQDEPSEEKSKASHFWLYVVIFHLILFPVFYFIRKKRAGGSA